MSNKYRPLILAVIAAAAIVILFAASHSLDRYLGSDLSAPAQRKIHIARDLGASILVITALAARLWPKHDEAVLVHTHSEKTHGHKHTHGPHHDHDHEGWEGPEPHSHPHRHQPVRHAHRYVIDDHHAIWPESPSP